MKRIFYISCLIIMFLGCTKTNFIIEDYRENTSTIIDIDKNLISLYPRITGYGGPAVGETPFPSGCIAQAFAFNNGQQLTQWRYYKSMSPGTLTPVNQPMEIVNGLYDFYFVSTKSSSDPPVFLNGTATVYNTIDYLWYKIDDQTIENTTTLPINFEHCCAQIVIKVFNAPGDSVVQWTQVAMMEMPNLKNVGWDLYSGVITPATSINSDSLQVMNSSGLNSNLVILPVTNIATIYLYLAMQMYDGNFIESYNLYLPVPDSTFKAGTSYHYDIMFANDTVLINNVNIAPWIDVDEEGNPLYPIPN
ncbi:MAG: fimbrillin family protein [Marinifilaceae bacterium]